jgi:hypothetical protein
VQLRDFFLDLIRIVTFEDYDRCYPDHLAGEDLSPVSLS